MSFKLKGSDFFGKSPLKQSTPPKVTYKRNILTGKRRKKTYTPPGREDNPNPPTYHYDRKGNVKKIVDGGKTTKIKKGHRAPRGQDPKDYN
mgnify:CR=1 FL=1